VTLPLSKAIHVMFEVRALNPFPLKLKAGASGSVPRDRYHAAAESSFIAFQQARRIGLSNGID